MAPLKIRKSVFYSIAAMIAIYLFVFQPPVINKLFYPLIELVILIGFLILKPTAFFNAQRRLAAEHFLIVSIILVAAVRDMISGEIVYLDRLLAWWFQSHVFGVVVVLSLEYKGLTQREVPWSLYGAGVLASFLTLCLFLFPSIDGLYQQFQIYDIYDKYAQFELRYRAYGISENLTFTYGYILGMFAGYSYIISKNNPAYLVLTVIFAIGAGLNARIGFLPFILLVTYSVFINRSFRSGIALLIILSALYVYAFSFIGIDSSRFDWVLRFFSEIRDFIFGEVSSSNTIVTILTDFVVWPQNTSEWLFGSGKSLFLSLNRNTDIGYILQLNYAGLFFVALIVFYQVFVSWRIVKRLGLGHWFPYFFIFSMFVLNTKGFLFAATPGGRLIFVMYIYFIIRYPPAVVSRSIDPLRSQFNAGSVSAIFSMRGSLPEVIK